MQGPGGAAQAPHDPDMAHACSPSTQMVEAGAEVTLSYVVNSKAEKLCTSLRISHLPRNTWCHFHLCPLSPRSRPPFLIYSNPRPSGHLPRCHHLDPGGLVGSYTCFRFHLHVTLFENLPLSQNSTHPLFPIRSHFPPFGTHPRVVEGFQASCPGDRE